MKETADPIRPILLLILLLVLGAPAGAGDDPSIQGDLRTNVQAAMNRYVDAQTIDGSMRLYDPVTDELLVLRLDALHEGIVRKGDYYVSCADFEDPKGRKVDVDFLVIRDGDELLATQAIVHSVDGKKRAYHLE